MLLDVFFCILWEKDMLNEENGTILEYEDLRGLISEVLGYQDESSLRTQLNDGKYEPILSFFSGQGRKLGR